MTLRRLYMEHSVLRSARDRVLTNRRRIIVATRATLINPITGQSWDTHVQSAP